VIAALPEPPIIMGHSFGGALTQLLLDRGHGAAGVAIDSAPPEGIRVNPPSQIKSGPSAAARSGPGCPLPPGPPSCGSAPTAVGSCPTPSTPKDGPA
jgi:pimeloyl-ACP methyl ester carboxylesterase